MSTRIVFDEKAFDDASMHLQGAAAIISIVASRLAVGPQAALYAAAGIVEDCRRELHNAARVERQDDKTQ